MDNLYLLNYDNGVGYDDNESYTIGVFNDYQLAIEFILSKGFKPTSTHNLFDRGKEYLYFKKETITVEEIKMNVELNNWGEIAKENEIL